MAKGVKRVKVPGGQDVEFDAKGRVLMSRGAQRLIGFGMACFGLCVAIGIWMLRSGAVSNVELRRRQLTYVEASCRLVDVSWSSPDEDSGRSVGVEYDVFVGGKSYRASRYAPDGNYIRSSIDVNTLQKSLTIGKTMPCWHDPADPTSALLVQATQPAPPPMEFMSAALISAFGAILAFLGVAFARSKRRWAIGGNED